MKNKITFTTKYSETYDLNEKDALDIAKSQWRRLSGTSFDKLKTVNGMFKGITFDYNIERCKLVVITKDGKLPFE